MSPKPVAGARRKPEAPARDTFLDGAMVVVALVPGPKGVEVRMQNRAGVDNEDLAVALRGAADQLEGKNDRAKGCW